MEGPSRSRMFREYMRAKRKRDLDMTKKAGLKSLHTNKAKRILPHRN